MWRADVASTREGLAPRSGPDGRLGAPPRYHPQTMSSTASTRQDASSRQTVAINSEGRTLLPSSPHRDRLQHQTLVSSARSTARDQRSTTFELSLPSSYRPGWAAPEAAHPRHPGRVREKATDASPSPAWNAFPRFSAGTKPLHPSVWNRRRRSLATLIRPRYLPLDRFIRPHMEM